LYNTEKLALAMQAAPGFYALLLGSGISSSARIPTGWDIVLDLLRRLAAARGITPIPNSEKELLAWYETWRGDANAPELPDYSWLITQVYPDPERELALQQHFDVTEEERHERGADYKSPTAAHKAIARLVKKGYVRLVVTTNFDRLLENALTAEGVEPTAVTYEQLGNIKPLHCYSHMIVKLHGDYKTSKLRNSEEQLSCYCEEMSEFLRRVFRDYKWIICGWSAQYDKALAGCFTSAKCRWHPVWIDIRELSGPSRELAEIIGADKQAVPGGADAFFRDLEERVMAIEDIRTPPPSSPEIAAAMLKRCLSGPYQDFIRAHDMIVDEARQVAEIFKSAALPLVITGTQAALKEEIDRRISFYNTTSNILSRIVAVAVEWSPKELHSTLLRVISELVSAIDFTRKGSFNLDLMYLQLYLTMKIYYIIGILCVRNQNNILIADMLRIQLPDVVIQNNSELIYQLHTATILRPFEEQQIVHRGLSKLRRACEFRDALCRDVGTNIINVEDWNVYFDVFEFICAFADFISKKSHSSAMQSWLGIFHDRYRRGGNDRDAMTRIFGKLVDEGWFFGLGFYGNSIDELRYALKEYWKFLDDGYNKISSHVH
jgi:hypothetical protein